MKAKRRQRLNLVILLVLGISGAVSLGLYALKENLMYYYTPTEVAAGKAPQQRAFKTGGLVKKDSIVRATDSNLVTFVITDNNTELSVHFRGITPDLFTDEQGMIAEGKLQDDGIFMASNLLAKHDENYMPPEVAASLEESGQMPKHEILEDNKK